MDTSELRLLRAFLILMRERSVSRAADRLGLSQPAMSHLLARLRPPDASRVYFDAFNSALRFHRSGQTRLLATTGSERSPVAPEIPTVSEAGMPGYVAETAFMLMAPAGIPAEVTKRLVEATRTVMADKALWKELEGMGVRAVIESDPEAANAYIRAEFDKWTPVVKSLQKGG